MIPNEEKVAIIDLMITRKSEEAQSFDKWEAWYVGDDPDGQTRDMGDNGTSTANEFRIDTNYMFAFIDTMNAIICPQNPQINLRSNDKSRDGVALAREAQANATFKRGSLESKLPRSGMFASIHGDAYLKTTWRKEEMRVVYQALSARNIFWDVSVPWEDTRFIVEAVPYTKHEFKALVAQGTFTLPDGREPTYDQMPSFMSVGGKRASPFSRSVHDTFERVVVYEFHDLIGHNTQWWINGWKEPIAELGKPYRFMGHPYSRLWFNERPDSFAGLPDAKLIEQSQDKLNEINYLELWHAFTTIPKTVMDTNAVDDPESTLSQLENASNPGAVIRAGMKDDRPASSLFINMQVPSMLPAFDRMRDQTESQIARTLGLTDYQRGGLGGGNNTATEVSVADHSLRTRNGYRSARMKSFIKSVAKNTLALWREFFPKDAGITLPGRSIHSEVYVDRLSLAFGQPDQALTSQEQFEEEWYFEYEVAAASPAEQDKAVQLQKLATYLPAFLQAKNIDQAALFEELATLLDLRKIVTKAPPQQPGMMVPGMPGSEGTPGMPGSIPTDGSLPPGMDQAHEAALPPETKQLGSPPKLEL